MIHRIDLRLLLTIEVIPAEDAAGHVLFRNRLTPDDAHGRYRDGRRDE